MTDEPVRVIVLHCETCSKNVCSYIKADFKKKRESNSIYLWFFEKVVKTARIHCFSRKVKISKWVGKNIEKAYKIVLFCKKSI